AVGQCVKQNLIDNMGIDSKCIEVINNGIDINSETKEDLFKGLRDNNCTIIVSISRFSYEKGLDILIDSVKEVVRHDNNVRFVIVGDGEEKENLIKQCEAFNIKKYVDFVGFKSNVLDYIKSSDFVVSTSRTEGFPVVPLETFSQGKTIVATNVGGTKEIVINNETGLLVNSEDISQISSAIIKLIDDKDLRIKMENKAYNLVTENFSVDKMCDQYYEYYKSIINKAQIK
ncbi:MAG: glycosyltransferase family 4 protein, partial [Clostridium sp.]